MFTFVAHRTCLNHIYVNLVNHTSRETRVRPQLQPSKSWTFCVTLRSSGAMIRCTREYFVNMNP